MQNSVMSVAFRKGRPTAAQLGRNVGDLFSNYFVPGATSGKKRLPQAIKLAVDPSISRSSTSSSSATAGSGFMARGYRRLGNKRRRTYSSKKRAYSRSRSRYRGRSRVSTRRGRGRLVLRRRGRRSYGRRRKLYRRGDGSGWTYRTNERPWPPTDSGVAITPGIISYSLYGQIDMQSGEAGNPIAPTIPVTTGPLYVTTPPPTAAAYVPGTPGPYSHGVTAIGINYAPFFHTNIAFSLSTFPAFALAPFWDLYKQVRVGRVVMQFNVRGAIPTTNVWAASGSSTTTTMQNPSFSRGGDAVFCLTSRTGPLPLPRGYVDPANLYTNGEALANLNLHPFYRVINMDPGRRKKFAVIRRNISMGMKPVVFKFQPRCVDRVSLQTYYGAGVQPSKDTTWPASDLVLPGSRNRYWRRSPMWHDIINTRQVDYVDPGTDNVKADETLNYPYHGVAVSFRPGSWTESLFPQLIYRVWIRVHFRGRQRPLDGSAGLPKNQLQQMNYEGRQIMYS